MNHEEKYFLTGFTGLKMDQQDFKLNKKNAWIRTPPYLVCVGFLIFLIAVQDCFGQFFPTGLPERQFQTFSAEGFSQPVVGVIYRYGGSNNHGVPVGGIGTGYLNVDLDGTIGEWTIFNNLVNPLSAEQKIWLPGPVGVPRDVNLPFLGLATGGSTWMLSLNQLSGVGKADQIHYWGHYPVADLEYDLSGSAVDVGLRAWAPFIPGDVENSNIPGMVFEVQLRNTSGGNQSGTIAISVPGMNSADAYGLTSFTRSTVNGAFSGVGVTAGDNGYALGILGGDPIRHGSPLGYSGASWANMATTLPSAGTSEAGTSVAVDFSLSASETKTVRFVLAWYAPFWPATPYTNMYRFRYCSAVEVAKQLAAEHATLLQKVLAWQQIIYTEGGLPDYVREGLVNALHSITKGGFYVCNNSTNAGLLSIFEAAGYISLQDTSVVAWWGDIPLTYFFPNLRLSTLRKFAEFQDASGRVPFALGTENNSLDTPVMAAQVGMNGIVFTHMADRLLRRLGDPLLNQEFYPIIKKTIQFHMTQDQYNDGLMSKDPGDPRGQTMDSWPMYGEPIYLQTLWLAALQMAKEMATDQGDTTFASECSNFITLGTASLETNLWNPATNSYLLYKDPGTAQQSDTILSFQLDGSFVSALSGLPEVFPANRVATVLNTIKTLCVDPITVGAANGMRPNGTVDTTGGSDSAGIWSAENSVLAAIYAYKGDTTTAESIFQQMQSNLVLTRQLTWNFPQGFAQQDGVTPNVGDYYWGMALWAAPPALLNQDITQFCAAGNFADRIIQAGQGLLTSSVEACQAYGCGSLAAQPNPTNGSAGVDLNADLNWVSGCGAAFVHRVIFTTDPVAAGNPATPAIVSVPNATMSYDPGLLDIGTTYYWRIDEVDGPQVHTGTVWSFTTVKRVHTPDPIDGGGSGPAATLGWQVGPGGPYMFNVYLSDQPNPGPADLVSAGQSETFFTPAVLQTGEIYYWHVDAIDSLQAVHTGDTWSFQDIAPTTVAIGSSNLIGALDYSDSFNTSINGRNNNSTYINYSSGNPGALAVENNYGRPAANWSWNSPRGVGGFAFRDSNRAKTSDANPMADSGCFEMGGGLGDYGSDPYIPYGLRDNFVVQFDAILTQDRIDVSVGDGDGLTGNCLSIFFRIDGHVSPRIGLFSPAAGETDSGLATSITSQSEWNNFAVHFDRPENVIRFYVNEVFIGELDLNTFANSAYKNYSTNAISIGIGSMVTSNLDNFQVGQPESCPHPPSADANGDCKVNFEDLMVLVTEWMI